MPVSDRRFALLLPMAAALFIPSVAAARDGNAGADPAGANAGVNAGAGIDADAIGDPVALPPGQSSTSVDQIPDTRTPDKLTIGAGVAYLPSYEGSDDYIVQPIGAFRARVSGFNISTRGTQISADLIRDPPASRWNFQFGPVLDLNLNRTGKIVDRQVRALGKRAVALEVGGYAGVSRSGILTSKYDTLSVRVTVLGDVSGVNRSYEVMPAIEYGTPLSRHLYVGLSASVSIVGDSYARTYFAVDPTGSARSGLPLFDNPKGGLKNFALSGVVTRSITGDLTHGLGVYAAVSYSRLQGDFARSPIVSIAGDPNQLLGAIGLGYTF